eukprot:CAMPEP_0172492238 /NCGR_PEP_ID=MMETSP1066-20121228/23314_1 /TAXON_ID=671091 /ORGANISM="Coscinodiscus wailesii, Strain CCMP2513" /LENGTH=209 /DNA_ID=CAMNT_0013261741 /DNA_START=77 /DNA_END=706 /DNA_ORIENTATION=+
MTACFKKSSLHYLLLTLAILLNNASAGFKIGKCADPEVVTNFSLNEYLGQWYEVSRDEYTIFELWAKCVTAKYTLNDDNGNVLVRNNSYYRLTGWVGVNGEATLADPSSGEANLEVAFGGNVPSGDNINYQVIDTDYEKYAIVYGGSEIVWGLACVETVWVLSRTPMLSDEDIDNVKSVIKEKLPKYDYEGLAVFTKQGDDCPYDNQPE